MASIRKNTRSNRWEVRYRDPHGVQRTKGGFTLKADAKAFKARIEVDMQRGDWMDPKLGRITVEHWAHEFLSNRNGAVRATTYARDKQVIEHYVIPSLGRMRLVSVKPLDVTRMFTPLKDDLAPRTLWGIKGVTKLLFNAAIDHELIRVNPVKGLTLPTVQPTDMRLLSLQEIVHLADSMPAEFRAFPIVGGVLGPRFSELAGFRVGSVDFLRRTATIAETIAEVGGRVMAAPVKTKASRRTLTAPSFVIEAIAQQLALRGSPDVDRFLFEMPRGGPLRYSVFHARVWKPAVRKSGLGHITIHGLRHSAAGLMIAQGHHARTIMGRMGHSSITVTMNTYGRLMKAQDDAVARSMDDQFEAECGADVVRDDDDGDASIGVRGI
jgi:integrase